LGEERFQVDFTLVHPAITLDVIGGVLFGEDLEGIAHLKDGTCTPIVELIEKLSTIYVKKAMLPPFLRRVFGVHSGSATLKEIQTKLNMYLDEIITKLKTKDSGEKTLKDGVPLFQYLIRTTEADSGFQREDLLDNMKALYFGGYETTAHALNFLIWHLLKNPTCLQKVVEEIDEHYDVDFIEHLTSFKYLGNAIKESMRLDPVAIAVSREALADTTLAGYTIEKGTVVTINTIALQHNETFWPNPTTFNPDRFNNTTKPGTYFPFGEGTQNCIGQKLAMAEIKVYMIMLLKHYKLELVPGQDIRVVTRFTSDLNQLGVYLEKRV
jgi:cytochrome P450